MPALLDLALRATQTCWMSPPMVSLLDWREARLRPSSPNGAHYDIYRSDNPDRRLIRTPLEPYNKEDAFDEHPGPYRGEPQEGCQAAASDRSAGRRHCHQRGPAAGGAPLDPKGSKGHGRQGGQRGTIRQDPEAHRRLRPLHLFHGHTK